MESTTPGDDASKASSRLQVKVLGAGAGGGSPQWNCGCEVCQKVRRGEAPARTQTSIAVSADTGPAADRRWTLINCSPDVREQLLANRELWPARPGRHSPVSAVVLTGAEIDQVTGLLTLREGHAFGIYGSTNTLEALDDSAVFSALDPKRVPRRQMALGEEIALNDAAGEPLGIRLQTFAVPGKVALYQESGEQPPELAAQDGRTVGVEVRAEGAERSLYFIPGCATFTPELADRLAGAAAVMFDGTLWSDDELIDRELSHKSGRRMGHMSISGDRGTLKSFEGLGVRRRIFIHLNNTNPVLLPDSPERRAVERAGWEVAFDGMELTV